MTGLELPEGGEAALEILESQLELCENRHRRLRRALLRL